MQMNWATYAKAAGAIQTTNNVNASKEQTHSCLYTSVIFHKNKEVTLPTPVSSAKYGPQKQIQTVHKSQLVEHNCVPRRLWHQHRITGIGEIPLQRCLFTTKCEIHDGKSCKLLPWHTTGPQRICAHQDGPHTAKIHQQIQTHGLCTQRVGII